MTKETPHPFFVRTAENLEARRQAYSALRASVAKEVIDSYFWMSFNRHSPDLSHLVADLMHFCRHSPDHDFAAVVYKARVQFEEEINEPDEDDE